MMTVILVESHIAKSTKVSSIACLLFGDEHSPEYWKTFYIIMKANSHIAKPLNYFFAYLTFILIYFCDCLDMQ